MREGFDNGRSVTCKSFILNLINMQTLVCVLLRCRICKYCVLFVS